MNIPTINHQEVLSRLLPEQIETNALTITQVRQAKAERNSLLPLRCDIEFLSRLNDIFAPVHAAQVQSNIPVISDKAYRTRAAVNLDMIERLAQTRIKNKHFLDIGCGRGYNIREAHKRGALHSIGIDESAGCHKFWTDQNNNTGDVQFILADLHAHDFQNRTFDVISSFNSFEHFDDPVLVLNKCRSIINNGGSLLIKFNPIFHAPMGSHQYRTINIPYVQNIFDDEVVAEYFFKDKTRDPYPGLNRKKVREFDEIIHKAEHWTPVSYKKVTDHRFAWMSTLFNSEFQKLREDDLYVSGIITVLKPT